MPVGAPSRHVAEYRERGYAVVRGVFDKAEIAAMAAAFDREYATGLAHGRSFRHGNLHYRLARDAALGLIVRLAQWPSYHDPVLHRFRNDPRMFDILEPLIGRDIKQIINQLHWKPPGAAMVDFAFHQDVRFRRPRAAYRNLIGSYVQTGIAVDAHSRASGAMRILPCSQTLGELSFAGHRRVADTAASEHQLLDLNLDPSKLVDLDLAPGDVALWNTFTVHGSGPNITSGERRFYLNGYVRAADCDRGEWAFRDGKPCDLGPPELVHYEELRSRPEPHYVDD
ncbi:MAG TPA: phytanoyl-CoA dioxygenase family protein [Candidatus Cybelea sp.]|nr:phytanoyl-CoA dioxygenase family protein [Candidatus Cybelea sp.]